MRTTLGIIYTVCGLAVLMTIYQGWGCRGDSDRFDSEQYLSYEELQSSRENWQYPEGWQFMAKLEEERPRSSEKRGQTEKVLERAKRTAEHDVKLFNADATREQIRRDVGKQISQIAENLRFQKESMEKRPIPPILKIWEMRRSNPKTYEIEQDRWEFSDFEKQTGGIVSDVSEVGSKENKGNATADSSFNPNVSPSIQPADKIRRETSERLVSQTSPETPTGRTDRFVNSPRVQKKNPYFVFKNAEPETEEESKREEIENSPREKEMPEDLPSSVPPLPENLGKISVNGETLISLPDEFSDSEQWEENNPNAAYDHEEGLSILRYFNQKARRRLATYSDEIRDYSCILYKWDQSNTSLDGQDVIWFKLREEPFSFYGRSVFPQKIEGREMLFWTGHYDQMLIVNTGAKALNRTIAFDMDSNTVQKACPKGLGRLRFSELLREMEELSRDESKFKDTQIRYFKDAQVGKEKCYAIQITYNDNSGSDVYRIQIYVTYSRDLPVKIVFYDWPQNGKQPEIQESYLFVITELNPGFKDIDFCHLNPSYGFKRYIPRLSETETNFMKEIYRDFLERQNTP